MALPNTTTLSAAVGINDTTVLLAALTNVVAGQYFRIDQEFFRVLSVPSAAATPVPVLRGQEGTAQAAHSSSAQVLLGAPASQTTAGDWPQAGAAAASLQTQPAVRLRTVKNYTAAGAIAVPPIGQDQVAIIDGTGALAMTLVNPSVIQDGDVLTIIGNGKAAHTVTWSTATSGIGNGGANVDVATFAAGGLQRLDLMAAGGFWCSSVLAGTLTNITVTMS